MTTDIRDIHRPPVVGGIGKFGKEVRGMQELLAKVLELFNAHPIAGFAVLVGVMFVVLIWGVLATSYRYR